MSPPPGRFKAGNWRWCFAALGVLCLPGLASPFLAHALAGTGGVPEWLVDLAAHWQWLFLLILLPSAVVAALGNRSWALLLLAAPLPWLSVSASAPALHAAAPPDAAVFAVASANVYFRNQDVAGLAQWLAREQPDVVVVLEVTPAYAEGLQSLQAYPHRHVVAEPGAFGIAILSRHPLEQVQEVRDAEGIALIQARIRWRDRLIGLAALHPMPPQSTHYHAVRNARLESVTRAPGAGDMPMIVAGDLNATPWSNAFTGLGERGWHRAMGLAPTWPAAWGGWLGIPIDQILVNRYWTVAGSMVGPDVGSDHFPVLVRLVQQAPASSGLR